MHVYDGRIWQEFQSVNGIPFLSLPFNYAFLINIDWFQPYKHTVHSEGVIYLALLNLPRQERFLQKNVILVGVIPGPKEPKKNVNSFLAPLVEELLHLWKGVIMTTEKNTKVLVRAALICCSCDIPAARKCCDFVGCNALHSCSRCMVEFPTAVFGESPDFSNLNYQEWTPRSSQLCKEMGAKHRDARTQAAQKAIEKEYGIRYSILNELPYFNPSRICIIDPMHNLLLGTVKHMIDVWKSCMKLKKDDFETIQETFTHFVTPPNIGRLPHNNIASGFSGFTAEQYKIGPYIIP